MTASSYLCAVQFLTDNFLVETGSVLRMLGSAVVPIPVSYKFGGSMPTRDVEWTQSNLRALRINQNYYTGVGYSFDMSLSEPRRTTNCMIRIADSDDVDVDSEWQAVLECGLRLSEPLTGTYVPQDIYFGRRASKEYFYFHLPRNIEYATFRLKLFDPNESATGNITLRDVFLGDSVDVDRAPAKGISHQSRDLTKVFVAESGREYFLDKPIFQTVSSIELPMLKRYQVSALKIWSDQLGVSTPFWMILDPQGKWDAPVFGATFGAYRLQSLPLFRHQFFDTWSCSLEVKEVL